MSVISFKPTTAVAVSEVVESENTYTVPYDTKMLSKSRLIRKDKDGVHIWSLDPMVFLKAIENDDLDDFMKISALLVPSHTDRVALWDLFFDFSRNHGTTGCVLVAGNNFEPLSRSSVAYRSPFVTERGPTRRMDITKIAVGNRIAVGVRDVMARTTYVALYHVDSLALAPVSKYSPTGLYQENDPMSPAVNLSLTHIYSIDPTGGIGVALADDATPELTGDEFEFVKHIHESLIRINSATVWKSHLKVIPAGTASAGIDMQKFVTDTCKAVEDQWVGDWNYFESACRTALEPIAEARRNAFTPAPVSGQRRRNGKGPRAEKQNRPELPALPVVSAIVEPDKGIVTARFSAGGIQMSPDDEIVVFSIDNLPTRAELLEHEFLGRDLSTPLVFEDGTVNPENPGIYPIDHLGYGPLDYVIFAEIEL